MCSAPQIQLHSPFEKDKQSNTTIEQFRQESLEEQVGTQQSETISLEQ